MNRDLGPPRIYELTFIPSQVIFCATLLQRRSSLALAMASSHFFSALPPRHLPASPPSPPPSLSLLKFSAFRTSFLATPFPIPHCIPARRNSLRLAAQGDNWQAENKIETQFDISRLEKYTEKVPNEVLRVHAVVDGEEDQVLIFKGFSSSLTRATAFDPAEPVLPASASIRAIDRIRGPYNPAKVLLIKGGRGLSWQQFHTLLQEKGL